MVKKIDKKAFTLIEVLVVVAIIGILALLAIPRFIGHTQKAELVRVQHDVKAMEKEIGAKLINGDDSFNEWESNSKDLNQLVQDKELFENEGVAKEVDSTDGPYKIIPKEYKAKINTKLKGTFYANSGGKVYYEHGEGPGYSDEEIDDLIKNHDFIPVATADELNNVRSATLETYGVGTKWEDKYTGGLDKKYIQVKDINLSGYSVEGWVPIGTDAGYDEDWNHLGKFPFTGTYDGGNYVITGLEIKGEDNDYQGLFGYTEGATILNVGLIDNKVTGTGWAVGGLVGYASGNTRISNSYATGAVMGDKSVGGLIGVVKNSTISNSYATGEVTGTEFSVGGLVGQAEYSTIENSYAIGEVTGTYHVGGLVGDARYVVKISNSYATGSVTGTGISVGGLVGDAFGITIRDSYSTGEVIGSGSDVGGLVGLIVSSTIRDSYSTGSVTGSEKVGGLVGYATGSTIRDSYSTGSVIGNNYVGGLVGEADGSTISNSYAEVAVTGNTFVGGLVGAINTMHTNYQLTISNSYATGEVTGTGNNVGGLVGWTSSRTTISNSYYIGLVKGPERVGGLLGYAKDKTNINNSYATGSVIGSEDVGGLVGIAVDPTTVNVTNSYWDKVTTGQTTSAKQNASFGKTTDEMKKKETYEGWNFDTIWKIDEGNDYPKLR